MPPSCTLAVFMDRRRPYRKNRREICGMHALYSEGNLANDSRGLCKRMNPELGMSQFFLRQDDFILNRGNVNNYIPNSRLRIEQHLLQGVLEIIDHFLPLGA